MQTIKCSNDECREEIVFSLSELEIEDSQPSGNHTTQHSASGEVLCKKCNSQTEINCVWDELDDTGEILSLAFT